MQRSPNPQIVTALEFIAGTRARDEKARELAYDVIKLLETDGLVYTKKGMHGSLCVLEHVYVYIYICLSV